MMDAFLKKKWLRGHITVIDLFSIAVQKFSQIQQLRTIPIQMNCLMDSLSLVSGYGFGESSAQGLTRMKSSCWSGLWSYWRRGMLLQDHGLVEEFSPLWLWY